MSVWTPPTFAVGQRVRVVIRAECPFANSEITNGVRYGQDIGPGTHACHAPDVHGLEGVVRGAYPEFPPMEGHPYSVHFGRDVFVQTLQDNGHPFPYIDCGHYAWTELEPIEEAS